MKKPSIFTLTTTGRYLLLSLIVLVVGVPMNYQLFSHWKGVDTAHYTGSDKRAITRNLKVEPIPSIVIVSPEVKQNNNSIQPLPKVFDRNSSLLSLRKPRDNSVVTLTKSVVRSLGVKTIKVERTTLFRQINSLGHISVNENNIRTVSLRTEGWIEKLHVKAIGDRVSKGDLLLEIYSPKLVNAQEDYVHMLGLDEGNEVLIAASKQRLMSLGVSEFQIEVLRSTRKVQALVSIFSPQDGYVFELAVHEGGFVTPSTSVVSLVDLSSVWLLVDVFENKVSWVKPGQRVEATLPFLPGKVWRGTVDFLYPSLDPKTRSIKARLRFDNTDELLKPNMYAKVSIFTNPKLSILTVPRESVIKTGRQSRVIIANDNGSYKPRIVQTGIETGTQVEILRGLKSGEKVVISSQFLIDSESSMQASMIRMTTY